jgi:hypothetical protein
MAPQFGTEIITTVSVYNNSTAAPTFAFIYERTLKD